MFRRSCPVLWGSNHTLRGPWLPLWSLYRDYFKDCVPLDHRLNLFKVFLAPKQETVYHLVAWSNEAPFQIRNILERQGVALGLVVGLVFLKRAFLIELQEILKDLICPKIWNFQQFVQEHLQDHHSLPEVFVIVAPELSFFGNRRDRNTRMQPLESGLKPFEVRVSAFYSFLQDCSLDVVADVGLLEYSPFSLLELGDCDADIFCREEGTRGDF